MVGPRFEWFVAWRHLRDEGRKRSWKLLKVGLALIGVGVASMLVDRLLAGHLGASGVMRNGELFHNAKLIQVIDIFVGIILSILGILVGSFTFFTALSMFGVFLGTALPIIALSVMSGFELDLKSKIRATKADVVIGRADDAPFTDWDAVQTRIAGVAGVVDSMAYIESEAIVKHISNPAGMGIILRGVDPARARRVLDLGRTLREGTVDYLVSPKSIPTGGRLPEVLLPDADDRAERGADKKGAKGAAAKAATKKGDADADDDGDAEHDAVTAPSSEPPRELPGILLGEELFAHTLRVYLGSEVDVACPLCGTGPAGPMPKLKSFRVAGHFYTGLYEFDSKLAYVALADAQKFLGMRGEVTGIEVRAADADAAIDVAERVARLLGPGYEVRSWQELNRALFMALRLEKLAMFVVLTFIALVASFSIVSSLIMTATRKGREMAILKSMGASDGAIRRIFVAEGIYIGLVGLAIGLVFGIGSCILISRSGLPLDPEVYYIQKLPVVMRVTEIVSVGVAALVLCGLATLYPAHLASRLRPVEGLRYE